MDIYQETMEQDLIDYISNPCCLASAMLRLEADALTIAIWNDPHADDDHHSGCRYSRGDSLLA